MKCMTGVRNCNKKMSKHSEAYLTPEVYGVAKRRFNDGLIIQKYHGVIYLFTKRQYLQLDETRNGYNAWDR